MARLIVMKKQRLKVEQGRTRKIEVEIGLWLSGIRQLPRKYRVLLLAEVVGAGLVVVVIVLIWMF